LNNLLLIKSVENYVEIYLQRNNKISRFYLRKTLKKVDEELIKYSFIFRCHRSYIINTTFAPIKYELKNNDLEK